MRKWYVALGARPSTSADTATALVPEPGSEAHGTLEPYADVLPYSKRHLPTVAPLGLTLAFSVAEVEVSAVAELVSTLGALGSVVNVLSTPLPLPPSLLATM